MTEGRKCRWGTRALFGALAALAIAAAVPAVAGASPAEDEYDLNLPEADGQSNEPTQQSAEDSSASTPEAAAPASDTSQSDDDQGSATAGGAGGGGNDQGGGGDSGGAAGGGDKASASRQQPFASSADEKTVPDLAADRSDGGGISVPLILLAIAAAACAGIAFWRLRRSKGDADDQGHEAGTRPGDVARGTQSS
jgi:cobalamin biosynthesis Mg chelatase CobN